MMHMHVRRPDGRHLPDAQAYRDALAAVQAVGDELLVQVTSEAAGVTAPPSKWRWCANWRPRPSSACARSPCRDPESELAAFLAWLAERR